ncbi:MAG: diguanylate cyclase [Candidatus Kuenenia sp.]|nr:diguanylate cyclase [Candidatus Kuenenia hertensis]
MNAIIEDGNNAIVVVTPNAVIKAVNHITCEFLGYKKEELIGSPFSLILEEGKPYLENVFNELMKQGSIFHRETGYLSKNGKKIPVLLSGTAVYGQDRKIQEALFAALNVAGINRIEEELRIALDQRDRNIKELGYLMYFSCLINDEMQEDSLIKRMSWAIKEHFEPDVLVIATIDMEKNCLVVPLIDPPIPASEFIREEVLINPSQCDVLRTGKEHFVTDIRYEPSCKCMVHKLKEGGYACVPLMVGGVPIGMMLLIKKQSCYWEEKQMQKLLLVCMGLASSALYRVRLLEYSKHAAITDALTGIYNRRFFDEMLEKQIALAGRNKEPLSIIIADIDNFKKLNDKYGHIMGDRALQYVAKVMKGCIRLSDILARYGGEEFVIIMPATNTMNAMEKAEQIRQRVESIRLEMENGEGYPALTISIGVATFPVHGTESKAFVWAADEALLLAKKRGKNMVMTP